MAIDAVVFDAYGTLYDVQSVHQITEEQYPGKGELITQVWRLKQLEYTWLRSQMRAYRSFWDLSAESLRYTLDCLGLDYEQSRFEKIMDKYLHLDPYPDTLDALDAIADKQRAILSNGNQSMLDELVANTGLSDRLEAVISVERRQVFKPDPGAYTLIEEQLGVKPSNVLFVSSNAFDACGAKHHGLQVAWIERVTRDALRTEIEEVENVGPTTLFKLLRMRMEHLDLVPDHTLTSLSDLRGVLDR